MNVTKIREALPSNIYEINNVDFGFKISLAFLLFALGVYLALQTSIVSVIAGIVMIGLMMAHFVELQHQALHNHGFRSVRLNRFFGIILGLPMLISFSHYQARHIWHHRKVGTPEDSEFFDYKLENGKITTRQLIGHLVDVTIVYRFFNNLKYSLLGLPMDHNIPYKKSVLQKIHAEYKLMGMVVLIAIVLAAWGNAGTILMKIWILPFCLVAVPVHFLIECPEHIVCDKIDDPFRNTRTILSNRFMTWFTNGNNFHVEHHMFPSIPMNRMREVHRLASPSIVYYHKTYIGFFKSISIKG